MVKSGVYHATVKRCRRPRRSSKNRTSNITDSRSIRVIHVSIRSGARPCLVHKTRSEHHDSSHAKAVVTDERYQNYTPDSPGTEYRTGRSREEGRYTSSDDPHQYPRSDSQRSQPGSSNRVTPQRDGYSTESKLCRSQSSHFDHAREHHRYTDRKKKKTHLRLCIVISLLVGFLLLSSIIIIPTVLLTRPKATASIKYRDAILRWNTTGITVAGITNLNGSASDRLNRPYALAVDYLGTLYISDQKCHRIQCWLRDASTGTTVAGNANCTSGSQSADLYHPADILLDSDNNMYIADSDNSRIVFWPNGAVAGRTIAGNNSFGNSSNRLNNSLGVSVDWQSNTLYVADYNNHRIMRFPSNSAFGTVVAGGNGAGTGNTQLNFPTTVLFEASSNSLLIVNLVSNNIVRWKIGDTNWSLVAGSATGASGATSTLFRYPVGTVFDPMGNMYVADAYNHRVQFFLTGQSNGTTIAGITNSSGNSATYFNTPSDVVLDNQFEFICHGC